MISAISMIVLFQCYWINRIFNEEKIRIQKQTDVIFKELIYQLQLNRFKADTIIFNSTKGNNLFALDAVNALLNEKNKLNNKDTLRVKKFNTQVFNNSLPKSLNVIRLNKDSNSGINKSINLSKKDIDSIINQSGNSGSVRIVMKMNNSHSIIPDSFEQKMIQLNNIELNEHKINDTNHKIIKQKIKGTDKISINSSFISMLSRGRPLADSLPIKEIDSAYGLLLKKAGIFLPFKLQTGVLDSAQNKDSINVIEFKTSRATVGFVNPRWYQASFPSLNKLISEKIVPQILFSLFLIIFTSIAFVFLYRNIVNQQRLALFKNEFISNVTHELKTPIATVQVAVEALKNFNAIADPDRANEYLNISTLELQRLNLLVDKVLKLSMFESDKIILNKEWFNIKELIDEVVKSLQLQFEKNQTIIDFQLAQSDLMIFADRLHISSVLYNLFDNSLKYSGNGSHINIELNTPLKNVVSISVTDNGIGIPQQFQHKIFEKFFRVPTGDTHNVKGYGLGLSYVSHILKLHQGFIELNSELGKGSIFKIILPIDVKDKVDFRNK